jgi:hypothetical protein
MENTHCVRPMSQGTSSRRNAASAAARLASRSFRSTLMAMSQRPDSGDPETESGGLGCVHLRRLWARMQRQREGRPSPPDSRDRIESDVAVFDGLNLVIEETLRFLVTENPSLPAFEAWVLEKNAGFVESHRVDRINAITEGRAYSPETRAWLAEIEAMEPVLASADLDFFDCQGYVILPAAISREECQQAARAIWDFAGKDPDDPDTWYQGVRTIFILLYHHPALWVARRSRRIHKAYAQIWGTTDLWPAVDKASLNLPEREGWRFPGPRLHWDVTLVPPIGFGVQGILYLVDVAPDQGAFTCVPGFHKQVDDWLRALPLAADPRQQDLVALGAVPVPGRAGDLILYHHGLPHGGSPNKAARPRVAQFLDFVPARRPTESWPNFR